MNTNSIIRPKILAATLVMGIAWLGGACGNSREEPGKSAASPSRPEAMPHADVRRCLEIAFEAGSRMPTDPHARNRARLQSEAAESALDLGALDLVATSTNGIEGWRRPYLEARLAEAFAKTGDAARAEKRIENAVAALNPKSAALFTQDWQRDRVKASIARALIVSGRTDAATPYLTGLVASEADRALPLEASRTKPEGFVAMMTRLDACLATNDFDRMKFAVEGMEALPEAILRDAAMFDAVESKHVAVVAKFPVEFRATAMLRLAERAIEAGDPARARRLIDGATAAVEGASLLAEDRLPLLARAAAARHRCGDVDGGTAALASLRADYASRRARIVDIRRSGVVRGFAEAAWRMDRRTTAHELWLAALDEGMVNPNSRPRADDLAATCRSLAASGARPEPAFLKKAEALLEGLGDPW